MNIAAIFQRKRQKETEVTRPLREQYQDIVRSLARGDEIDESEVLEICDALHITEGKLSKDVTTQQERFTLAAQLYQRGQATADIDQLTHEREKLEAERQAFLAKLEPKLTTVVEKLRAAELVILQTMFTESKLVETCLDEDLNQRGEELEAKRRKVGDELRALESEAASFRNKVSSAKSKVEYTRLENSRMPNAIGEGQQEVRDRYKAQQLKVAQDKMAAVENAAADTFARLAKLKAEQQRLQYEQDELNRLKLVP